MSSLFRSAPLTRAQNARKLLKDYAANREKLIKKLIQIAFDVSCERVEETALELGLTNLRFELTQFVESNEQVKKLGDEFKIQKFKLSRDERLTVLQALQLKLSDEGFVATMTADTPQKSGFVDINWKEAPQEAPSAVAAPAPTPAPVAL